MTAKEPPTAPVRPFSKTDWVYTKGQIFPFFCRCCGKERKAGVTLLRVRLVAEHPRPAFCGVALQLSRRAEALHPLYERRSLMKNKKMSIRISEEHLAAIHRKAEQTDMTFTDYVTKSCLGRQIVVIDGLNDVLRQQKCQQLHQKAPI